MGIPGGHHGSAHLQRARRATRYTRFADAADKVEHTQQVLSSIDRVLTRLVSAETGHRGYLLTSNRSFLQPYEGVQEQTRALLRRARRARRRQP